MVKIPYKKEMKKFGNILWGLVLVALGIIFGLNALGITDINIFFKGWWTLIIIIPSFIGLFKNESKVWSLIWLAIGIVLLLCAYGILSFTMVGKLIFPFILVMIGLNIIFKDVINKNIDGKIKKMNSERIDAQEYCSTFGGQNVTYNGEEFKGANLDAVFGSVELDLKNAKTAHDQVINASAIFGGIDITVPDNVNIKVKSTPIFGGVSNKVKTQYNENLPTIYINSFCMFGGVEIK